MHTDPLLEAFPQEKENHLRDYLQIVMNRKGLILTVTVITFLLVTLNTCSKTPVFTATTQVLIEKNMTGAELQGTRVYMMWDPEFMATQFELVRSYNVARRVVDKLQLDTRYRDAFINPAHTSSSIAGSVKQTLSSLLSSVFSQQNRKDTPSASAQSTSKHGQKSDAARIASMIQAGIRIAPIKDTKIVRVSYTHEDPAIAQMVANTIVQAYIDETLEIKTSLTKYSLKWMTAKAAEERRKLEDSEKSLQQYMRDNDIITIENKLAIYPQKLSEFSSQLSAAQTKEKENEAIYSQIKNAGKDYTQLETLPLFSNNSVLQNLRERIYASEQNIKELSKKYGYKHPIIIQAKAERNLLLKEKEAEIHRIEESTKKAYELSQTRVKDLTQFIATAKKELQDMNERFIQYTIMKRDMEMNRSIYDALTTSIKKENVTEQSQDLKIWVTKKADLPGAPSAPNTRKALLQGLMIGLIGGILLAFFIEYLDNTVKSEQEIEERYELTVLGAVEELSEKKSSIETYIQENPLSPLAESYRLIRSSLLFSTPDHPPQTLLITSMMQQEGKTTTTGNLAHILAQNNNKVLIIDCDMRRPRQHSLFGITNMYGLSNYLSGNTDEKHSLIQNTPNEAISMIPAGPVPPNPAELLISKKMALILEKAQQQFDFILLDSPPVQQVTDSLMLGQLVAGTIVVVRAGTTTHEMLHNGIKKLRDNHVHILGVVLNRMKKAHMNKGYSGYYSYYSRQKHPDNVNET
jgi:capsular exopolysaccharide synthesis family protein